MTDRVSQLGQLTDQTATQAIRSTTSHVADRCVALKSKVDRISETNLRLKET